MNLLGRYYFILKNKGDPTNILSFGLGTRLMKGSTPMKKLYNGRRKRRACGIMTRSQMYRYFPDFIVRYKNKGIVMEEVVEIKPQRQITDLYNPKRRTKIKKRDDAHDEPKSGRASSVLKIGV